MKILISGSSGFVGNHLVAFFQQQGHKVSCLVRRVVSDPNREINWDPDKGFIQQSDLEGFDAVIHLAGENVANRRWTAGQKAKIRSSRIDSTELLVNAILQLKSPPQTFFCSSATGYYGNRGDEVLDESSDPGKGFLPDLCVEWEETGRQLEKRDIRVVFLRFGIILDSKEGALKKMLLPFKLGVGGVIGNGKQFMPWIAIDDVIHAVNFILNNKNIHGPLNMVSPNPVTNYEFTKTMGNILARPTIFPQPAFLVKLLLGQMADELLLSSARVVPKMLLDSGFTFQHSILKTALLSYQDDASDK